MKTPKRYQFDNRLPDPAEPPHLPVHQEHQLPHQQVPQVVHIHHAPPDRTVQRLAMGAGVGGGAVAGGVVLGPMLATSLAYMAVTLAVTALVIAVTAWAVVAIVKAVSGTSVRLTRKETTK